MQNQYSQIADQISQLVENLAKSGNWEKCASEGECIGYKKDNGTGGTVTKGQMTLHYPIESIVKFLNDDDTMKKLNEDCVDNKILEKNEKYEIRRMQVKTPFPMDNREVVSLFTHRKNGNVEIIGGKSVEYNVPPKDNVVRARMNIGGWYLEKVDAKSTRATHVGDFDPMGNVPDMLKSTMAGKRSVVPAKLDKCLKNEGF